MYAGGLICQKTVDWSHFGSSEVIQRFCPRSQRVVATVCLFVKSGVKWHLLTNRQTVTLSSFCCRRFLAAAAHGEVEGGADGDSEGEGLALAGQRLAEVQTLI